MSNQVTLREPSTSQELRVVFIEDPPLWTMGEARVTIVDENGQEHRETFTNSDAKAMIAARREQGWVEGALPID